MQSTGTPANNKKKGLTAETATGQKRNDDDNDNVISQGGATDKKAAEDGISAENNSNTTAESKDNNTLSPGVIVDRRDGDDNRPGDNVGRQEGNATPRTSKRHMQSTGTPANKKKKGLTAETATGQKRNDGDDDNVISQGGATDEKDADDGISAENNSNATSNDSVSKPGFSYLE
jgi:hypothetical protein